MIYCLYLSSKDFFIWGFMKTQLKLLTFAIAAFNLAQASDAASKEVFDMIDSNVGGRSSLRMQPKIDDDQAQEAVRAFKNHCETCDGCNDSGAQSSAVKIVGAQHRGYLRSQFDYLYNKTCDYLKVILDEEEKAREAEKEKVAIENAERKAAEEEARKVAEEKLQEEELERAKKEKADRRSCRRESCDTCSIS